MKTNTLFKEPSVVAVDTAFSFAEPHIPGREIRPQACGDTMRLPPDRESLVLEATWEIQSILQVVLDKLNADRVGAEDLYLRAFARRCLDLAEVAMWGVQGGPAATDLEELQKIVF